MCVIISDITTHFSSSDQQDSPRALGFILLDLNEILSLSNLATAEISRQDCKHFSLAIPFFPAGNDPVNKDNFVLLNMENVFWPLFIDTL